MSSEKQVPAALRQHMNQDEEIVAISAWATATDQDTLDGIALPKSTPYDKQRSKFAVPIPNVQIQCLITEHQILNKGNKFWDEFDPQSCTWQDVFNAVEEAVAEYEGIAARSPIRRVFRSEAWIKNVPPLLENIPENDGLGFLKGGLIILFNVMKGRAEARDKILDSLEGVPVIIADAQQNRIRFPQDVLLFTRTNELYNALFEAVPLLIDILHRTSSEPRYKKVGRSILGNQVSQVESILQPVVAAQRAVKRSVAHLATKRDDQDSKLLRTTREEVGVLRHNEMRHHVETIAEAKATSQTSKRTEGKVDMLLAGMAQIHIDHAELRKKSCEQNLNLQVFNAVYVIHADSHRMREFCRDQEQNIVQGTVRQAAAKTAPRDNGLYDTEQSPAVQDESNFDPGHILAALCSDEEIKSHVHDLYFTLRKHHDFSNKALAQAAYLVKMDRFRQWQRGSEPDILLVDGHAGSEGNGRTTPMSVFCATLIQSLEDLNADSSVSNGSMVVLYFFCGQHKSPNGGLPGPSGLMRSLIVQLILAWPEERRRDLQSVKQLAKIGQSSGSSNYQVTFLCQVFEELLWHLPPGLVVHGIVDGISHFETSIRDWSTDMRTIASSLETCAARLRGASEISSVFKMLLASAGKSTVVRDLIPQESQVSLRAGNFLAQPVSHKALVRNLSEQALQEEALLSTQAESSRGRS